MLFRSNDQNALTNDQGGSNNPGKWYNADPIRDSFTYEQNFWVYNDNGTQKNRCLQYGKLGTYKNFLDTYYKPHVIQ